LLDPLGLYLLNEATHQTLFFLPLTDAAATLVLIAFKKLIHCHWI